MAKWAEASDETFKAVMEVLNNTGLENLISSKIIVNDDQKKNVITIKKESPDNKFAYGYDLKIIVNEEIFDGLTPELQRLCIEEALSGTHYDLDNDKLVVTQADKVHRGFVDRYGWDKFKVLEESVKSLYDNQKNDGEELNTEKG
jgi:hypothetical protein